jgi:hypothetical protein
VAVQRQLIHMSQEIRLTSGAQLDLPMPEADAWIIGHMVSASMLQISLLEGPEEERAQPHPGGRAPHLPDGAQPGARVPWPRWRRPAA